MCCVRHVLVCSGHRLAEADPFQSLLQGLPDKGVLPCQVFFPPGVLRVCRCQGLFQGFVNPWGILRGPQPHPYSPEYGAALFPKWNARPPLRGGSPRARNEEEPPSDTEFSQYHGSAETERATCAPTRAAGGDGEGEQSAVANGEDAGLDGNTDCHSRCAHRLRNDGDRGLPAAAGRE